MAAAYAHAEGSQNCREIQLGQLINRFGVAAIMGRPNLGAGEARRILAAEYIVHLYQEKMQSENWAAWANDNPDGDKLLNIAMLLVKEG